VGVIESAVNATRQSRTEIWDNDVVQYLITSQRRVLAFPGRTYEIRSNARHTVRSAYSQGGRESFLCLKKFVSAVPTTKNDSRPLL
jgi:hypothetical protein